MPPFTIRAATLADAPAIGAVHAAAWRETYTGLVPDAAIAARSATERTAAWKRILSEPETFDDASAFVAVAADQTVAAFAACGRQRDAAFADAGFAGEFQSVYVLQRHQRQGIGRALMRAMAARLAEQGRLGASLWVFRDNPKACRFYESLGGAVLDQQDERRYGTIVTKVAYGWRDLGVIVRGDR